MQLLLGKPLADKLLLDLKERIVHTEGKPGLAVILVGNDPASNLYVGLKEKAAGKIGMYFEKNIFPNTAGETEILEKIQQLNLRQDIHGIIVQLPLPAGFSEDRIIASIEPKKDADGFHPQTLESYLSGEKAARPVFPRAIVRLIESAGQSLSGLKGVACVNSELFGKVMLQVFSDLDIMGEIFFQNEWEEKKDTLTTYDVVVTAWGEPQKITGDLLKSGAILIDGGITRVGEKVYGDIDEKSTQNLPVFLTPVPGGVGPVTVASLLERVCELAQASH